MTDTNKKAQERFGANIEGLRQRRGMSVEELAERSELGRDELGGIVTGEIEASASTAYRLAGALDVEPGDLFSGMGWTPPAHGGNAHAIEKPKRR